MKHLSTAAIIIGLFTMSGLAQGRKATLVYESDKLDCERNLEYLDHLFVQLGDDLTSEGYIVISGPAEKFSSLIDLDIQLQSALTRRHFNSARVSTVFQEGHGNVHYQFWTIPAGARTPFAIPSGDTDYSLPRGTKRFMIHEDPEEICSTEDFTKVFSDVLKSNPSAFGETVIYASSASVRRQKLREAKLTLARIPSARIRFTFRPASRDSVRTEYWVVTSTS